MLPPQTPTTESDPLPGRAPGRESGIGLVTAHTHPVAATTGHRRTTEALLATTRPFGEDTRTAEATTEQEEEEQVEGAIRAAVAAAVAGLTILVVAATMLLLLQGAEVAGAMTEGTEGTAGRHPLTTLLLAEEDMTGAGDK